MLMEKITREWKKAVVEIPWMREKECKLFLEWTEATAELRRMFIEISKKDHIANDIGYL